MEVSCGPDCKVKRKEEDVFKLKLKGRSNESKVISITVSAPEFRPSVYLVSTSGALQAAHRGGIPPGRDEWCVEGKTTLRQHTTPCKTFRAEKRHNIRTVSRNTGLCVMWTPSMHSP